jgi:hypothetical protein
MYRSLAALTTLVAAGLLAAPAAGKEAGVHVEPTPTVAIAGEAWTPTVHVILDDHRPVPAGAPAPTLEIRNVRTGEAATFPTRATGSGTYTARVVFPRAGDWTYTVRNAIEQRAYAFPPVTILAARDDAAADARPTRPAARTSPAPAEAGGGSAGLVAAVALALLAALAAATAVGRRRAAAAAR